MKKKMLISIIIIFIIFIAIIFVKRNEIIEQNVDDILTEEKNESLEELLIDTGKQGNVDWYEVQEGIDNINVATIKANIKYKVAFAGMIKKSKPKENELDEILEKEHPQKCGIWIYESDREKILNYLSNISLSKYSIDENGYLKIENKNKQNEYDKKIENAINGENIYCIKISSVCYIVDEITSEILDYSYEDMDKYQTYEYFEDENKKLIFVTENKNNQLENDEIIQNLINLL